MKYRFGWYVIHRKNVFLQIISSQTVFQRTFFISEAILTSDLCPIYSSFFLIDHMHTPELNWNLETYRYVSLEIFYFCFLKAWLFYSKHSLYIDQIWICTESHRYKLEKPNIICWIVICFFSNFRNVDYINVKINITG